MFFDIDNDYSENLNDWFTPYKVAYFFGDVPMLIQYSRNNMKSKNGKTPRPKFHMIMPIEMVTNHEIYSAMKENVYSIFPFVDSQALDAARFLYDTAEPKVDYIDGSWTLTERIKELEATINTTNEEFTNIESFIKLVKKYTNIEKLDCEILRTFVDKVLVYQAEKNDGKKVQKIKIIYNFIRNINK